MIRDRNIVCVASNWSDHPTSKHHVMRVLSNANHVLWVNYHASRRPRLTRGDLGLIARRLRQAWRGPASSSPRIEVLSPLLLPLPAHRPARYLNMHMLARRIRAALRRQPPRPTQLWLFAPDVPELIGAFPVERVVYYCVDDFAAFSGYDTRLMETLERRTMASADLVITTSAQLYAERRGGHPCVHFVPHGVDFAHFARAVNLPATDWPADVRTLPRPILGYMGVVSDYVDLGLIAAAARARPAWSFVLLGEVRCDVSAVRGLPNVHILGPRPYTELPAYCAAFDVGLIPFLLNRLTRAVNPIKLHEYLAAGLPVVSSPMSAVLPYEPAVRTAETADAFLRACEAALATEANSARLERQNLVRSQDWQNRVEWLSKLVMELPPASADPFSAAAGPAFSSGAATTDDVRLGEARLSAPVQCESLR